MSGSQNNPVADIVQEDVMLSYQSRRHRRLMQESEQALADAADSEKRRRRARIVRYVLDDSRVYQSWECRHADLLLGVAEQSRRVPQILELRNMAIRQIHRQALIDYIHNYRIRGSERDRLFRVFYGPRDPVDSMLIEHRQFVLATSSSVSARHLIDVMCDPVSGHLLCQYRSAYTEYFDLFCHAAMADDAIEAEALRLVIADAAGRATRIRRRLRDTKPENGHSSFDRQALLAQSGRYPILDYMVG